MGNIAGLLQQSFGREVAMGGAQRVPMLFSSLKRRLESGLVEPVADLVSLTGKKLTPAASAVRGGAPAPIIRMLVNPKSVRFSQPKRIARVDGVGSITYHHFTNDEGVDDDVLTIAFQGNTGNIDLRGSTTAADRPTPQLTSGPGYEQDLLASQDTGARDRLLTWQNLWALTHEPTVFMHGGQLVKNVFYVTYASALFPVGVTFIGFFNKAMEFEESGTKPGSRDYSMEFIATDSTLSPEQILEATAASIEASTQRTLAQGGGAQ